MKTSPILEIWPLNKLQSYTLNVWVTGLWESSLLSWPFFLQLPVNVDHTTPEATEKTTCLYKDFLVAQSERWRIFLSFSFQNVHLTFSARKWTTVMGIHCDSSLYVQRWDFGRQRELILCPRKGVPQCNSPRPPQLCCHFISACFCKGPSAVCYFLPRLSLPPTPSSL